MPKNDINLKNRPFTMKEAEKRDYAEIEKLDKGGSIAMADYTLVNTKSMDYFLKQMDKFADIPRAVLAHSTHVKGIGTYVDGIEKPRINVVLATGISRERCEKVNLLFMNPEHIDIVNYQNKEDKGILAVHHAGEMLYRLSDGSIPTIPENTK